MAVNVSFGLGFGPLQLFSFRGFLSEQQEMAPGCALKNGWVIDVFQRLGQYKIAGLLVKRTILYFHR